MHPDDIPGVREAKAWEAATRARAFLNLPIYIAGVEVVPLSLFKLGLLTATLNPFLCGGPPTPEAVAAFLWVVSPGFHPTDSDASGAFFAQLRAVPGFWELPRVVAEIDEFLEIMFLDAPVGSASGGDSSPITSREAVYVELFSESCGWGEEETMHMALPKLFQVLRRVTVRKEPGALFFNRRSSKVKNDWMLAEHLRSQGFAP